jgi:hypothetical protein
LPLQVTVPSPELLASACFSASLLPQPATATESTTTSAKYRPNFSMQILQVD